MRKMQMRGSGSDIESDPPPESPNSADPAVSATKKSLRDCEDSNLVSDPLNGLNGCGSDSHLSSEAMDIFGVERGRWNREEGTKSLLGGGWGREGGGGSCSGRHDLLCLFCEVPLGATRFLQERD